MGNNTNTLWANRWGKDRSGRAVLRRGSSVVRLLRLRVRILPGHGCRSLVSVVYCQTEVSASGWSPVQISPMESDVSKWGRKTSTMRGPWPTVKRPKYGEPTVSSSFTAMLRHTGRLWSIYSPRTVWQHRSIPHTLLTRLQLIVTCSSIEISTEGTGLLWCYWHN